MSSTGIRKQTSLQARAIIASQESYKQLIESYKPFGGDTGVGINSGGSGS
jgi:hypothetical protein